ncbi:glycoside hydrolase family 3 C-terminal domain-containing protein [Streptomyces sp. NPDC001941]|uniref:beta-glucosidase family protein n=1 Tax=Streptomyces sp. NPDC001941 TaxID=3154659 RepID=UPI00331AAC29
MPEVTRRTALALLTGAATLAAAATTRLTTTARAASPAARRLRRARTARVDELLRRLTLDEKISLLHGAKDPQGLAGAGYLPGVPRLRIPPVRLADGPAGARVDKHPATALPAPVLLASAFDPGLARRYGQVIGREGRALGQDVLLSPMVNLIRTPYAGRNFETFSEDPLLTSDLVAEQIRGIQGEGLIATVKHFALNNQEHDRMTVDVHADEQTLRETEARGFESAVHARVGAVMSAYNKVNGTYAAENAPLLTRLLRDTWHFDGWVMSDWYAAHSTAAALAAGLDMEMPEGLRYGAALAKAVRDGSVPAAHVDRAVRRVLTTLARFGHLDDTPPARPGRDPRAGARVAYDVAVAGATLLRNEQHFLPLTPAVSSLAVIGPTATQPFVSGGGSAHVVPDHAAGPLDTLRARAGQPVRVTHALGEDLYGKPLPPTALAPATDLDAQGVAPGATFDYRGTLTATEGGEWTFTVHYSGERPTVRLDGTDLFPVRLGVNEFFAGGLTANAPDGLDVRRATLALTPGPHRLTVTAKGGAKGQLFRLRHTTGATRAADVAEAVRAARAAHTVVLFAHEDATEGQDRTTLALPGHQEALIDAVTAANPRTAVVLNTSSAVTMPWLERAPAVLQMYYPGQEGAAATTAVLYGDADPGGRLTQTYPADEDSHPVAGDPRRYPGSHGTEEYGEGIHTGHRWYDAHDVRPLFPFGHGLSYTTFAYEHLTATRVPGGVDVTLTVRNTGGRTGTTVAQVYAGPSPHLTLDQPRRLLAGYRRLELAPGDGRRVTLRVNDRTLSSWDPHAHRWTLGTGTRTLHAGTSSRDLPLTTRVDITPADAPADAEGPADARRPADRTAPGRA